MIINGLDGLADSNPLWVRKWFYKIITEIIKRPHQGFETVPKLLQEAIVEFENVICKSQNTIEKEWKFTHRLKKYPSENAKGVSTGVLGRILGKDKGEYVYWYEAIFKDKNTNGSFSIMVPVAENLNIKQYTQLLFNKLKDTLRITKINSDKICFEILNEIVTIDSFNE